MYYLYGDVLVFSPNRSMIPYQPSIFNPKPFVINLDRTCSCRQYIFWKQLLSLSPGWEGAIQDETSTGKSIGQ